MALLMANRVWNDAEIGALHGGKWVILLETRTYAAIAKQARNYGLTVDGLKEAARGQVKEVRAWTTESNEHSYNEEHEKLVALIEKSISEGAFDNKACNNVLSVP